MTLDVRLLGLDAEDDDEARDVANEIYVLLAGAGYDLDGVAPVLEDVDEEPVESLFDDRLDLDLGTPEDLSEAILDLGERSWGREDMTAPDVLDAIELAESEALALGYADD